MKVNDIESLENGQLVIYAGEGKDGEVLFEYNGKWCTCHCQIPWDMGRIIEGIGCTFPVFKHRPFGNRTRNL